MSARSTQRGPQPASARAHRMHRTRRTLRAALALACAGSTLALPARAYATSMPAVASRPAAPQAPSSASAASPASPAIPANPPSGAVPTSDAAPAQALRFGDYAILRKLIPSAELEGQAAEEFQQIVYGAKDAGRLYPDTDPHVVHVREILDRLIPYALKWNDRAPRWHWQIAVIRSPDIRMYCLPGGKLVIYSGILDRAHLNDNELAMLLGHEIAHALREHIRERLGELQASQLDSSGTIPQLFGLADLGMMPLGIGSQLLDLKYTPMDETEADVIGSEIAARAGYDPRAAITLWDKLADATHSNRDGGFIYVHPYSTARRDDIIKRLPDMLALYAKALGTTVGALPDYEGIAHPRHGAPARK